MAILTDIQQKAFDQHMRAKYGLSASQLFTDLGKCDWVGQLYGWVPDALREIADFLDAQDGYRGLDGDVDVRLLFSHKDASGEVQP